MKYYGVTEQLKAENQIEWVRQMNACVAQAEETIDVYKRQEQQSRAASVLCRRYERR